MLNLESIIASYPENLRPFRRNILREYLQYKVLQIVFATPLSAKLSFLGGTALRIVHGNSRFSEDLDFDNFGLTEKEFGTLADEVEKGLGLEGFEVTTRNVFKGAFRCYIRLPGLLFEHGLSPLKDETVTLQLDTAPHHFGYEPELRTLNRFDVFTQIPVTPAPLLFSQKIFAAFGRKRPKGRDFYDIVFLLSLNVRPDYAYLKAKLGIEDAETLRAYVLGQSGNLDFAALAKDVEPFLFFPAENQRVQRFADVFREAKL
ncbi:nucleotidyl transferase AbiEii/AbiGii toxin family protein [Candidatus Peregrinibacteria bacterium]|nr:nucleotidyl transferase AbiEii/AbiGii toxin family protein [Candidatus Peregrinibacteria bacterium]